MKFQLYTIASLLALATASPIPPTSLDSVDSLAPEDLAKRQTPLNTFVTLLLNNLPAINGEIAKVAGVLTAFENLLAILTGQSTTYNELDGACKEYTVIFARGTTEPGNVGILVGPPFFEALRNKVGKSNLAIQGVNNYKADIDGYLAGGEAAGSKSMADTITKARTKCPNTKLVVSGYSQGGQLVHNAAAQLPAATAASINKVVIFGDPFSAKSVTNVSPANRKTYCNAGDAICINGVLILPAHLTYATYASDAANFVAS